MRHLEVFYSSPLYQILTNYLHFLIEIKTNIVINYLMNIYWVSLEEEILYFQYGFHLILVNKTHSKTGRKREIVI